MKIKSAMLYMLLLLQCFTVWAHNLELSTLMPENVGYSGNLVLTTSGDNGDCGVPDGTACVDVTGGIQPYSYKWSNGDTTYEIDDIPSGSYTVTVTDARGNSATTSIMLTCDDALNPGIEGDVWSQIGGDIDGELAEDLAGRSVAISDDGSIIAIGASVNDGGKVKVYQKSAGNWVQLGTDINGTITNGYIGYGVSLSSDGSVLAVSTNYSFGGKVEVFGYINGNWVQKGVAISASYSSFGYSVSLSSDGNTLAIGSPTYNNNTGRVRIYTYDGANWILGGLISGASSGNYFGRSVSLSDDGQKIAIGAPNNLNNSGYVRVFEYQSSAWVQLGNTILGEASSDFSGASVSLSADGSIVAIGAQYNDGNGGSSGHVRVFEYSSNWVQLGSDIDGNVGDQSGYRVSLSSDGKTLAVASPLANSNTGLVRIYDYNGVGWSQIGSDINGEASGDDFGYSIALDANGTSLVVGVPNNDVNGTESGKVKVFELLQEETACYNESTTLSYSGVTGGSGSYTYQWEVSTDAGVTWANAPGTSTQETYTISTLTETSYFRRLVVDATCGGQEYSNNTKVIVNDEIVISSSITDATCGNSDGMVTISVTGGSGSYTYLWDTGATTQSINGLAAGTYDVTVTDTNGCSTTESVTIEVTESIINQSLNGSLWNQIGGNIDGEAGNDLLGDALAVSEDGSVVAVGANQNDSGGNNAGKVQVYKNVNGTWSQLGSDLSGNVSDRFGRFVALSDDGNIVAVSAYYMNYGNPYVKIYQYNGTDWVQLGGVITESSVNTTFGISLALSADGLKLVIGSDGSNIYGSSVGLARVYEYSGGNWNQIGGDLHGMEAFAYFGRSVAISDDGTVIAVGAYGASSFAGSVRIFEFTGGSWTQVGSQILGENANDRSGMAVSLSGDGSIVAIGAPYNDTTGSDAGQVRIFENSNGSWVQMGASIFGEHAGDSCGRVVSISADGTIVAVGEHYNDDNENNSGQVRVFKYNEGVWGQLGSDINGDGEDDYFGRVMSLSGDGKVLGVGAGYHDGIGINSGQVKVFELLNEETACYNESTTLSYSSVTGGSGSYTYQWEVSTDAGVTWANAPGTSMQETYTISALTETSYFRRLVVDATCGGQEYSNNTKLVVNDEIVISSSITDATTCGSSDGMVNISVTGGSGEYTYLWDNGETTASINGFAAGDYELIVTDTNGCTVSETYTISEDCSGVWTGAVSTDWDTTGNWANAVVPTEIDDVTISAAPANQPVITSSVEISNLTVAAGAMLTVSDGGTLIVTETSTGVITVERSIGTDWFFTSCPVHGETIADFVANNDLASGTGENIGFGLYTTNTDTWMYLTQIILSVSGANEIPVGTGIAVKKSAPGKLTFTGTYNTLPTASDLGYGGVGDFNLVGNPFIANINVATVLNANSGGLNESTMWLWQGGAYITKNILTGGTLEPLDGFIVSSNSADSSINFTTSMMQSASTGFPPNPTAGITSFTLTLSNDSQTYGTDIYLLGGATTGIDNGFDSSMFTGSGSDFAVYTKAVSGGSTKKLAIQAIPVANFDQYTIPVGVKTAIGGTVTFSLSMTQNLGVDQYVYLYDNVTGSNTELTNGGTYQVTLPQGTDGSGRFYINMAATPMGTDSMDMNRIKIIGSTSTITILGLEQEATLTLFNMLGQQLVQRNLEAVSNQQVQVDVARGTYVVKVTNSSGATTSKVVIGK